MVDKKNDTPSTFPILNTDRLTLRDLRPVDAADVLVFRGDPIVQKYDDPVIHTEAEALDFIIALNTEFETQQGISWGVTLSDEDVVIGAVGLHYWNQYHRRAEAGYGLAHAYWGRGIGSEALRAILQFGFDQMGLNRIYARTIADNHESVRMLERLGFQREGTMRKHSWEDDGTFHDSAFYGLLMGEFSGQTRSLVS
jgi:ribosomal-protein-alanine N-acetyltransferase